MLPQTREPCKYICTWSCVCVHVYAQIHVIEYICTRTWSVHSHAHAVQALTHWTQTSHVHAPRSPCALLLENVRSTHFTTHNLQLYTFSRTSLFACMFCYSLLRAWAATGIMVYKLMRWLAWCEFAPNLITTHDSSIIYLWLCVVLYPYSGKSLDRLQREKSRQIFQPLFFSTKKWTKNLRKTVCPLCAFLM